MKPRGSAGRRDVHADAQLVTPDAGGATAPVFLHRDHLASVKLITGCVASRAAYRPYGDRCALAYIGGDALDVAVTVSVTLLGAGERLDIVPGPTMRMEAAFDGPSQPGRWSGQVWQ